MAPPTARPAEFRFSVLPVTEAMPPSLATAPPALPERSSVNVLSFTVSTRPAAGLSRRAPVALDHRGRSAGRRGMSVLAAEDRPAVTPGNVVVERAVLDRERPRLVQDAPVVDPASPVVHSGVVRHLAVRDHQGAAGVGQSPAGGGLVAADHRPIDREGAGALDPTAVADVPGVAAGDRDALDGDRGACSHEEVPAGVACAHHRDRSARARRSSRRWRLPSGRRASGRTSRPARRR